MKRLFGHKPKSGKPLKDLEEDVPRQQFTTPVHQGLDAQRSQIHGSTSSQHSLQHSTQQFPSPSEEERGGIIRRDDDPQAELTRMIGYLTATASEDWSLVLEVCERATASETGAKEAVRALRREFKYGEPAAQLSAARLWAIMLRYSSDVFITQSTSRKFLDTLEDLLSSTSTSPVVRERLLEVVAAAAYASGSMRGNAREGFQGLWRRVKPPDKPDEGIPFDANDTPSEPPQSGRQSGYEAPVLNYQEASPLSVESNPTTPTSRNVKGRRSPTRGRLIMSRDEDIRRLFQECKIGSGNAAVLGDALTGAKPEDLKTTLVIREFYSKCCASQELIYAQLPWVTSIAEHSRERMMSKETLLLSKNQPDTLAEMTTEEQLLAALLAANADLMKVLGQWEDLNRIAIEQMSQSSLQHSTQQITSPSEEERDSVIRRDEDSQAELTHYLVATASEDRSLVLKVCERASANETSAKEAVRALRREFKSREPAVQLSTTQLWAIMLRNSSDVFIAQSASQEFLDTLEDLLSFARTLPIVRERLLEVVAAAAYATESKRGNDGEGFQGLWRRVKPFDQPAEGVPFNTDDAMFQLLQKSTRQSVDLGQPTSPVAQVETDRTSAVDSKSTKNQPKSDSENLNDVEQRTKSDLLPLNWGVQSDSQVVDEEAVDSDCAEPQTTSPPEQSHPAERPRAALPSPSPISKSPTPETPAPLVIASVEPEELEPNSENIRNSPVATAPLDSPTPQEDTPTEEAKIADLGQPHLPDILAETDTINPEQRRTTEDPNEHRSNFISETSGTPLAEVGPSLPSPTIAEPVEHQTISPDLQSSLVAPSPSNLPIYQEGVPIDVVEETNSGQTTPPDTQTETDETRARGLDSTKHGSNPELEALNGIAKGARFDLLPISWAVQSESPVVEEEVVNFDCARGYASHYTPCKRPSMRTEMQHLTPNAHSSVSGSYIIQATESGSTSSQNQNLFAGKEIKFKPVPWWVRYLVCYSGDLVELVDAKELVNHSSTTGRAAPESREIVGYSID